MADARFAAARQAVRAVGLALRARRLYATGHALSHQALLSAHDALRAYVTSHGPLGCAPAGRGVTLDFSLRPYEDDTVAELSRALSAAGVGSVRFLAGITTEELAALVDTLHLPKHVLDRAGGAGKVLRERGVQAIALADLSGTPTALRPAAPIDALIDALKTAPDQLAARLRDTSGGGAPEAVRLLQALDRAITTWPRPARDAAWTHVAAAVVATVPPLQPQLCREVIRVLHEPWAASIAARWPPVLIAGIIASDSAQPADATVAASLRALHRGAPQARTPVVAGVESPARRRVRDVLVMDDVALKPHAVARFLNALPLLETARFDEGVRLVERDLVAAVQAEEIETVARVLSGLAVFAGHLPDARGDLAHAALHRLLSTALRDLVAKSLVQIADEHHPLRQALTAAPDEAVRLLLELLADEERLHVRREIVSLLAVLARGRIPLLVERLADPRWYVVRNVVTTLGEMRDPAHIPYLRAALRHGHLRVRKEALAALGALRTAEAVAVLAEARRHPDAETRAAAAHWHDVARSQGSGT